MNEFSMIEKYFLPLAKNRPEALSLQDDAAILSVPKHHELVVTSDTLVGGTHFMKMENPKLIAQKALRVNLSDLAAMGADPYAYQLCLSLPYKPTGKWARAFCSGLAADQKEFGIFCCGGDTTVTEGPLTVSITAFGLVPEGKAVRRSGARPGDVLVITGPVGDAFVGLKIKKRRIDFKSASCVEAYRKPVPRVAVSEIVRQYARAAIDISDGLAADVGHICRASGCAAHIKFDAMKFSPVIRSLLKTGPLMPADVLSGGDDYELALAVAPKNLGRLLKKLSFRGLRPQVIGEFVRGRGGVRVFDKNGGEINLPKTGWAHF